jgi:hypothetical protein
MLNVNNENSGRSFYFTQNISERNITGTAKIWLFYQTYSGGLGFMSLSQFRNIIDHLAHFDNFLSLVRWRNTPKKKILLPKKVFFQFNKITFSSLRLQDIGFNFSKFSNPPSSSDHYAGILTFCLGYYFFFPLVAQLATSL